MPTYDYKCSACGHAFEKFQSISAATLRKCPKCGKNALKRLIGTGAGVIFRGGGFYETDYRSESYKAAAKADSSGAKPAHAGEKAGAKDAKPVAPSTAPGSQAATSGQSNPPATRQSKRKSA